LAINNEKARAQIELKYYYGFVDIYKDRQGNKNSSVFLKFSIPIDVKSKTK
jgi:hypothetical protein